MVKAAALSKDDLELQVTQTKHALATRTTCYMTPNVVLACKHALITFCAVKEAEAQVPTPTDHALFGVSLDRSASVLLDASHWVSAAGSSAATHLLPFSSSLPTS